MTDQTLPFDLSALPDAQLTALAIEQQAEVARGWGVEAVRAHARVVFGKELPAHVVEWDTEIFENKRVGITAPPDSAKTTGVSIIFGSWWIGKHPLASNAVASAGDDGANDIAEAIANTIENNPRWRKVFPYVVPWKERGWSQDGYFVWDTQYSLGEWETMRAGDRNATLVAGGVGSKRLNGIRVTGIMILDDIHDQESESSELVCKRVVKFCELTAFERLTDEAHCVILQTRWNRKDIIATIAAKVDDDGQKMWKVFYHPAILTDAEGNERSYWPERHSLAKLKRKRREVGTSVFLLLYQGDDTAMVGLVLHKDWLLSFPVAYIKQEWNRYFGIDFARRIQEFTGGKTRDPDHFALAILVDTGYKLVLEDGFDDVLTMGDAEEKFFSMASVWKPKLTGIESNGSGADYYVNLNRRMRTKRLYYTIRLVNTTRNKGARMIEMAPDWQYGQVMMSDAVTPFLTYFRECWLAFGTSAHDDPLDAAYIGWLTAKHLLPQEHPQDRKEREEAAAHVVPVATLIERAFR